MGQMQLGDAIKQFLQNSRLKQGLRTAQIETLWEELMGKTIAKYTNKIYLVNNTLFIQTDIGPLKQEIQFQKQTIIEKLNAAFGETVVKDIVIQ